MKPVCVFFIWAISSALAMQIRSKRQADDSNDLEDRYALQGIPARQWNQFPGQNQRPVFPAQNQFPGQGQLQGQFPSQQRPEQITTVAPANNGVNSQACMRTCAVTSEYNPVCGTDGVTYTNPGRLGCAQTCGVNVSLQRSAPCPTTTVAPS